MSELRVGIIGCGGRGRGHARGYAEAKDVKIVACADPSEENIEKLLEEQEVPSAYSDYQEMLKKENLDVVSICTWIPLHHPMVLDSVKAGVKAIHAEKPMAPTWGEAREMQKACDDAGVVVTYCHQRRFEARFRKARDLVREGAIGELVRLEGFCSNLFDWATHWFDMLFFMNEQTPVKWVLGQIDAPEPQTVFGVKVENSGISYFGYENDVIGMIATGQEHGGRCQIRLMGTDGVIEIGVPEGGQLRMLRSGKSRWEVPKLKEAGNGTTLATIDIIESLREGREPELSGRKALMATELIFATYESSRRRAKITLPLDIDDSPLLSMLESGEVGPGA